MERKWGFPKLPAAMRSRDDHMAIDAYLLRPVSATTALTYNYPEYD